jgi:syntenin-1
MPTSGSSLYPSLNDFMGLQLSQDSIRQHMPETGHQVSLYQPASQTMIAPVTGNQNMGLMRSEVKQGIRQIIACKDGKGKMGIRVQHINKGVFVSFVQQGSPAAIAGLRFGDQILQINGETLAGFDRDKVMKLIKKAPAEKIDLAIRDRPFERAITLQKDSAGHVGFIYKEGKITSIVKDSSAARNGLLIEHNLLEVNGQNVVGLKDKEISQILTSSERSLTITIMPTFIYEHMVKCMSESLVKKKMDHSVPDL